jgi:hypothetical protein
LNEALALKTEATNFFAFCCLNETVFVYQGFNLLFFSGS